MKAECFELEVHDRIAHLQLSRADKRNSMIPSFWSELPALMEQLQSDGDVRVVVLSSTGPHFSSGMDLSVFTAGSSTSAEAAFSDSEPRQQSDPRQRAIRLRDTIKRLQHSFSVLEEARIPVLAAIQGGCIGAGVDLAAACDMRYATRDAFFTIHETNLAMTADVGTFPRICKLMPDGMVRELAYTGRKLTADEALQYGLVNRLYETQQELLDEVMKIAGEIALKAPMAVHGCKQMILHARDHSVADTLDYVSVWNAAFLEQSEVMEAMMAGKEKRAGNFTSLPGKMTDDDPIGLS
ncbi:crotonase/enoyl-CoA hydratase family protein [Granulosicoccus sp. 3-233]|uniref:crotonase/enoyl-CoA hydratase family protein n=1 Tax=Granulosicoccus sp. 3-233 TaxID=3417969 RepID=UPI003D331CD9